MLGTSLGPYQLLAELGSGGMAVVYRAHQTNMGRDVAVKVIYQELADAAGREQFQREARLIARLEHPHILPVHDFDGQSNPPYIVTRYLAGGTLKDQLATPAFNPGLGSQWRLNLRWLNQVAGALDYAHRQGIIHRDIKPSNVLLDTDENAFLADFGVALLTSESESENALTLTGTPFYAAPEPESSPAADRYALAVVAFELFTRALPFNAAAFEELLALQAYAPPPAISKLNPALPARLDTIFVKALAKRPAERYATATAFVEALGLALGITFSQSGRLGTGRLVRAAGPTAQNKIVTLLCVLGPHLRGGWSPVTAPIEQRGGEVLEAGGDTLLAVWGARHTSEDDAEQAVRAALTIAALPVACGLHTGPALISQEGHLRLTGPAVAQAQQLVDQAESGVLLSHDTMRAIAGRFNLAPGRPIQWRGQTTLQATYRALSAKARAFDLATRGVEGLVTPFVGRDVELQQLQRALNAVVEDHETQLVTLLSEAGLGKSRLLREFMHWVEVQTKRLWLFQGRAAPAMTTRPYALLHDVLTLRFLVLDDDPIPTAQTKLEAGVAELLGAPDAETAHLLGYLAGLDFATSPYLAGLVGDSKQLAAHARRQSLRFFARVAQRQPVLIELEDAHYADEASLEFFTELLTTQQELPLMLLALARPTLWEQHPTWGGGREALYQTRETRHTLITLPPLSKRESRALARALLRPMPEPPPALTDFLVERAEGNPLFMEELVQVLLDDHIITVAADGHWVVEVARLARGRVPLNLQGVLQTRFDTLLYPEKLTLQRAAVVGRVFFDTALQALDLTDTVQVSHLRECLQALEQRGFIQRREAVAFVGSTEYAFAQALMRDVAYASLPEASRRAYHATIGKLLANTERANEFLPLIAEHFQQAHEWEQAATYLERAGDQALAVSALTEALEFYTQACALAAHTDALDFPCARLWRKRAEAHFQLADFPAARAALAQSLEASAAPADRAPSLALQGEIQSTTGDYAAALATLTHALPLTRALGNPAVLARVLYALGDAHWRLNQAEAARATLTESLTLARTLPDPTCCLFTLNRLGTLYFQVNWSLAEQFLQEAHTLAVQAGNRERAMSALNNLAALTANYHHNLPAAEQLYQQALRIAQETGARLFEALLLLNLADNETQMGDLISARANVHVGLRLAQELQAQPQLVAALSYYANLRYAEGERAQALALWGLAQRHPAYHSDHQRVWERTLTQWGLTPAEVETELAQGAALDFDQTIAALLPS